MAAATDVAGYQPEDRDRAFRRVNSWTVGGITGVVAATGALSAVTAAGFVAPAVASTPVQRVPTIPAEAALVQSPRPTPSVIVKVVHVRGASAGTRFRATTGIVPPRKAPGGSSPVSHTKPLPPPPPPPPPPVCHSAPTHPC